MTRTALALLALTLAPTALAEPVDRLTAPGALADAPQGLEGAWSLSAGISGFGNADAFSSLAVALGVGHWAKDTLEIYFGIGGGVANQTNLFTSVFTASWFPWDTWVRPYLGGGLALGMLDIGGLDVFGGGAVARFGVLVPLNPRVALDWGVELTVLSWDKGHPASWGLTTTGLGVRWLFGLT